MARIDITINIPPLPAGSALTPDEWGEFIMENAEFFFDADLPSGQIGGTEPVEDVGIFYGDDAIKKFRDGAYRAITDVPIGVVFPYASLAGVAPENFLLCRGQLETVTSYPLLKQIIGYSWNRPGDESDTSRFRLPDLQGRFIQGGGVADYNFNTVPFVGKGRIKVTGEYIGGDMPFNTPNPSTGSAWSDFPLDALLTPIGTAIFHSDSDVAGAIGVRAVQEIRPAAIVMDYIIRAK